MNIFKNGLILSALLVLRESLKTPNEEAAAVALSDLGCP
jgi:hypothetical protein